MTTIKDSLLAQVAEVLPSSGHKVTVVGIGQVGMASAFSILAQNVSKEVCLIDVCSDKLQGELMDLQHGSNFLKNPQITASTDFAASANSRLCIVTAGVRQKEGESRLSLVQRNTDILKNIIPKLVEVSYRSKFLGLLPRQTDKESSRTPEKNVMMNKILVIQLFLILNYKKNLS